MGMATIIYSSQLTIVFGPNIVVKPLLLFLTKSRFYSEHYRQVTELSIGVVVVVVSTLPLFFSSDQNFAYDGQRNTS